MPELPDEQRSAIERLQAKQAAVSEQERRRFIQGIISVPKDELPSKPIKTKKKARKQPSS
jgi:hypothetical protein